MCSDVTNTYTTIVSNYAHIKKKTEVERSQVILGQTTEQHVTQKKKLTTNWGFDPTTILVFRGSTNRWVLSAFTLQIHRGDQMACARGLM